MNKNDETTAFGVTTRIRPADFLAALERAGYEVPKDNPFGEPSGEMGATVRVVAVCETLKALAVPASVRRFYDDAVKSVAAANALRSQPV